MLSTVFATIQFLRALLAAAWDPASRGVVILAMLTLVTGTFFYRWSEGWATVDALYFSVVTLTTIGYGDLVPTTTIAKLFTIMYSLIGIGIIAAFITSLALSVRDQHERRHGREPEGGEETA
jgi:voltage-gated potassium channel Kch